MITIKLFIFNKIMRLFYALFQLTHLHLFYRISEDYYYKGYMCWLDNCFVKQGVPTDDMLNDMAIDAETEHDEYMRTHYTFVLSLVCPLCHRVQLHRISNQFTYVDLCDIPFAEQQVHDSAYIDGSVDAHYTCICTITRFCSTSCVEHATQGCSFAFDKE